MVIRRKFVFFRRTRFAIRNHFGHGNSVTNTTSVSVTNTYAGTGSYTATLTVTGAGGSSTTNGLISIAAYPKPRISSMAPSGASIVFSGTNCPSGVQYRILSSTNLSGSANWVPVTTNDFLSDGSFSYMVSKTNPAAFFRLVSP
jgi:PKD repeat protein